MVEYNMSEKCPKCGKLVSVKLLRDWVNRGRYYAEFECIRGHVFTKSVSILTGDQNGTDRD